MLPVPQLYGNVVSPIVEQQEALEQVAFSEVDRSGAEMNLKLTQLLLDLLPCPTSCLTCTVGKLLVGTNLASELCHPFRAEKVAVFSAGKSVRDVSAICDQYFLVYHTSIPRDLPDDAH